MKKSYNNQKTDRKKLRKKRKLKRKIYEQKDLFKEEPFLKNIQRLMEKNIAIKKLKILFLE